MAKKTNAHVSMRKFPARGTIGHLVLTELHKNMDVTCAYLQKKIFKHHPDSKFNEAHLAWYKTQIRKCRYEMPAKQA